MTVAKILPYQGGEDVRGWFSAEQNDSIETMKREFTEGTLSVLCASNMDTGKTAVASQVVADLGFQRVLYIGMKDTFEQWEERLAAQSDGAIQLRRIDSSEPGRVAFDDMAKGAPGHYFSGSEYLRAQDWEHRPAFDKMGWPAWKQDKKTDEYIMVPFDGIGPQVPKRLTARHQKRIFARVAFTRNPMDLIIYDEVHVVADRKSIARRTTITIPTKRRMGMSGTFYGNKFENTWSITRWLWPELIDPSFDRWQQVWCGHETIYMPGGVEKVVIKGERYPGEFVKTLPCYIRIDGELDPPEPEIVLCDLLDEQREDYDNFERDCMVWLNSSNGQRAALVADIPIVLRTHLRSATLGVISLDEEGSVRYAPDTRSTKLNALRGIVDRPDWTGRPVAIYTHSKQFAKVIVARMNAAGYHAVEWSGDVTTAKRKEIKTAFLAGQIPYLVCVIASFKEGLDGFQKVCNRVVWISESDNNVHNLQSIKRFYRSGDQEMLDDFQHVKIVARNTYDEGVLSRNAMETLRSRMSLAA